MRRMQMGKSGRRLIISPQGCGYYEGDEVIVNGETFQIKIEVVQKYILRIEMLCKMISDRYFDRAENK